MSRYTNISLLLSVFFSAILIQAEQERFVFTGWLPQRVSKLSFRHLDKTDTIQVRQLSDKKHRTVRQELTLNAHGKTPDLTAVGENDCCTKSECMGHSQQTKIADISYAGIFDRLFSRDVSSPRITINTKDVTCRVTQRPYEEMVKSYLNGQAIPATLLMKCTKKAASWNKEEKYYFEFTTSEHQGTVKALSCDVTYEDGSGDSLTTTSLEEYKKAKLDVLARKQEEERAKVIAALEPLKNQ